MKLVLLLDVYHVKSVDFLLGFNVVFIVSKDLKPEQETSYFNKNNQLVQSDCSLCVYLSAGLLVLDLS